VAELKLRTLIQNSSMVVPKTTILIDNSLFINLKY